jgi:uncharacterized transporter YbjL
MDASFYSVTAEIGRSFFNAFTKVVDRDDARVPSDQVDLMPVLLFVALGILLTAVFFTLGFWVEFGRILAVAG